MQTVLVKVVLFTCIVICVFQSNNIYIDSRAELVLKHINFKKIVQLSPNPSLDGNIVIESFVEDALSFYLFDKDAHLIRHFNLKGKSSFVVRNLKKGSYMYDVFLNEESIEHGNIIVK